MTFFMFGSVVSLVALVVRGVTPYSTEAAAPVVTAKEE